MITNGVVSVEDGNKANEEYAPARKVKVEFTFSVDENQDVDFVLNFAAGKANDKVNELLGRKSAKEAASAMTAVADTAAKTTRKPRVTSAKEPATGDKAALEVAAGLVPGGVIETTGPAPSNPEVVEEDSLNDLLGEQAPVPITDAELAKAAQTKNAQMKVKDPNFSVKIRALVVEYAGPPPKKITDVPVATRQEFLNKLRDLV